MPLVHNHRPIFSHYFLIHIPLLFIIGISLTPSLPYLFISQPLFIVAVYLLSHVSCRFNLIPNISLLSPLFFLHIFHFRGDVPTQPLSPAINWEETVCLNLLLQRFQYRLTMVVSSRTATSSKVDARFIKAML